MDQIPRTPLVASVLGEDPADAPLVEYLTGYLGNSTVDRHTRIYPTIDLKRWIDVPDQDFLHVVMPPAGGPPSAPSLIWVRAGAVVRPKPSSDEKLTLERYFAGDLYSGWSGRAQRADPWDDGSPVPRMRAAMAPKTVLDPDGYPTRVYPCGQM